MAWRKWLVRSLVFSVLGLAIVAALLYEAWTNPVAVRRQVLAKLDQIFTGATVSVDSARLRLLGGIGVRDLRMGRRDQLDRGDFLYVPSAVIYHDKEHLLDGTLAIRKVELDRPRLRIVRERDGQINLAGLLAPPDLKEHVPTLIVHQGIIVIEDHRDAAAAVLLEIKQANLTVVNDPLPTLVIEGSGQTDALGAVQIHARFYRPSNAVSAVIELPEVPIGPPLMQRLAGFCPDFVHHIRDLSGVAKIQTTLAYRPSATQPWTYDVSFELSKGQWRHDSLPAPLQHIHAELRCINGRIPHGLLRARSESAAVEMDIWDLAFPEKAPKSFEDILAKLEAKVEHVTVTPEFFEHLPQECKNIQKLYNPSGPVSLSYQFQRSDAEHWQKHWTIQPEGMSAEFESFRYPIDNVTGVISVKSFNDSPDDIKVDLYGQGSGRPVEVHGAIHGNKNSEVALNISADDVPIDRKLLSALPSPSLKLARMFLPSASRDLGKSEQSLRLVRPAGLANIKVFVRRARGQENFANRYLIALHDAAVKYDLFPYPLENVTGVLDIQPDHWECRDFHGSHKDGHIWGNAGSDRVDGEDGQQSECVQVEIHGKDILLDPEFEQALSPAEVPGRAALRQAWAMLALRGRLNFESIVRDRPDQPQDIDVVVNVKGCSMQPDFFRYSMSDVEANVRYKQGRVYVKDVSAKHGPCRLTLKDGVIVLKPGGGFTAWFTDICGEDLLPDEDFLRALHPVLQRGLEPLQIRKPLFIRAAALTLDAASAPGEPMKIWWDGGAALRKQTFQAGVEIDDVDGIVWCRGHYDGRQLESVKGNAVFDKATILGQPFTQLRGRIEVAPEAPDTLALYELGANLFGGFVGGEARFKFGSLLSYDVKLDALRIQLEQFGKHNHLGPEAQFQGPARAALHLTGEGSDLSGLRGNGCIEVARGKMLRLPLLLGLLKAFGLRLPDQTAFEQAQVVFGIEGPKMFVHRLDLFGNAISLRGQGTVNLDGSNLNLDFSADWGRVPQMLPPGIRDLSQAFSDQLFKIKLRGKITSPRFEKEAIPGVVDPIKKAFGKS